METVLFSKIARFQFRLWLYFRLWKLQFRRNLSPNRAFYFDRQTTRDHTWSFHQKCFTEIPSLKRLFSSNGETESPSEFNTPSNTAVKINSRILEIYEKGRTVNEEQNSYSFAVDQLQDLFLQRQQDFNTVNLATLIHRLGVLTRTHEAQEIILSRHKRFLNQLLKMVDAKAYWLTPQEVGNISWGLGLIGPRLGHPNEAYLESIFRKLGENLFNQFDGFRSQNITNFLLGLVRSENKSMHLLLPGIMLKTKEKLKKFNSQELTNLIWSLTKLNYVDTANIIPLALSQSASILDTFIPQQLSILMWSLTTLQVEDQERLVEEIMKCLLNWKGIISSQSMANVFWSLQQLKLRFSDEDLTTLLCKSPSLFKPPIGSMKVRHLSNILIALSDFECQTEPVEKCVRILKDAFLSSRHLFNPQDICNMLWALLIMDDRSLNVELMIQVGDYLQNQGIENLRDEDVRQFFQCLLHIKVFRREMDVSQVLPRDLEIRWRFNWSVRQGTSPLPLWVADALVCIEDMGFTCRGRFLEQGLINTCQVDLGDYFKYAIEGISFTRSYRNLPRCPQGRYRWKVKLLEAMGYEVIAIEEDAWLEAIGQIQKREYLKERIQLAQMNIHRKLVAKMKS